MTVTTALDAGYMTKSIGVTTGGGMNVPVTGGESSYSFVMPSDNVILFGRLCEIAGFRLMIKDIDKDYCL